MDEAHNIFLKNKTYFVSESVTDRVYREMREYGTCLICLDQHLSKLSDTVKGNSACHIAFQQQLPQDVLDVSSLMNLSDKREIFTQLPVGFAVAKLSERYTSPFLIKVPYNDLRNSIISDEKIFNKMDCVVEGIEVEKSDPEFKEALIQKTEDTIPLNITFEASEIPRRQDISAENTNSLTKTQKALYDFVCSIVAEGKPINEAERLLEKGLPEKVYTEKDILLAVNYFLEKAITKEDYLKSLREIPQIKETVNVKVEDKPIKKINTPKLDSPEEERFIGFLIENPNHTFSTVEIYKKIGVSPRKGNVIKNKLLEKGIIKIQEQRSSNGWKKIIKLNSNQPN